MKRASLLSAVLLGGLALFLGVVSSHYAFNQWLIWRYLWVAALALFWGISCLSFGYFLLERLGIERDPDQPEAVLAFPLGVFAFETAVFLLGLAHLLGTVTFVLLPVAFLGAGARRLARIWPALRAAQPPRTFWQLAIWLFGLAGIGLVYFQILLPDGFHWDARWYHLPLAQNAALEGAIRPSPVGWWLDGYPHAASFAYAWAFLLPHSIQFDRLELCAHMEMVVFLGTVFSIPAMVRALAPGVRASESWAVFFLFPAILLFDGNLSGEADHFAALFCIPLALSLIRLWRSWNRSEAILFGAFLAAVLASKYSAWSMAIFPALLAVARGGWLALSRLRERRDPRPILVPGLLGVVTTLALSGQHWLKNWLWYGDPLFPVLYQHLHVHPWSPESPASFALFTGFSAVAAPGARGLLDALGATFTFSFVPNDWPEFHHDVPIFGSLFTLFLPCLLFVRTHVRLWVGYLGCMAAIVVWYVVNHRDRYIQAWLPCMVACTAAAMALVWQQRALRVRLAVVALVAAQIAWGSDVPFFPAQNLIGDSQIRAVAGFIASGFLNTPNRLRVFGDEGLVGAALPKGAVLLVHERQTQLGFNARVVDDQWQGRLSYGWLGSPAAIQREVSKLGVTHVVWEHSEASGWNSLASDLAFYGYALNYAIGQRHLGRFGMGRIPATVPDIPFNDRVLVLMCGNPIPDGVYHLRALANGQPEGSAPAPEAVGDLAAAIRDAGFLAVNPACHPDLPPEASSLFHPPVPILRGGVRLYARRLPGAAPPAP
ncbi:MAG TPA: hypothetical protein VHG72_18865 [Polyangia bacterium]|nr:hypothetical protein [Polyangia bacterium]